MGRAVCLADDEQATAPKQLRDKGGLAGGGGHDAFFGGVGAGDVGGEAALAHDEDAVAHAEDLGELGGDHDDGDPLLGELGDQGVDLGLGADVDAAGGFVEDENLRLGGEPAGDDDLLLVAAGEGADALLHRRGADAEVVDVAGDERALAGARRETRGTEAVQHR